MGCDIHVYVEDLDDDGNWQFAGPANDPAEWRNYRLFSALADVRSYYPGQGPEPRGMPDDISATAFAEANSFGEYHSHSWYDMKTACELWRKHMWNAKDNIHMWPRYPALYLFGVDEDDPEVLATRYRVVFWFDN